MKKLILLLFITLASNNLFSQEVVFPDLWFAFEIVYMGMLKELGITPTVNGQTTGYLVSSNGERANYGDTWYHSNGERQTTGILWYHSNGERKLRDAVSLNGEQANYGDTWYL